jgi:hypothetical protein
LLEQWTDNDIRALLRDSRSGLRGAPLSEVVLTTEIEIEETGERVDIDEPADMVLDRMRKRSGVVAQLRNCL